MLVLSGGTRRADLPRYTYRPDLIVESLAEYAALLHDNDGLPPWIERPAKPRKPLAAMKA